ncbi:hypothetical protein OQZ55_15070 [Bacillus subtilis]|uniref:hypothetical protein n=1 Tax=Bacillus subtilis TaxID=1423 RepID=UPI00225BC190|nr:hypothetical protein [Bacillus subtilis]MCX4077517.1 hypothetical protein [Bacillus subtilis]
MKVKEIKAFFDSVDDDIEVCRLASGGFGYGLLPTKIKPVLKDVEQYDGTIKKMIVFEDTLSD